MSTITQATHPFYDKHHPIIKAIWNTDKQNTNSEEKLAALKEAVQSSSPSQLCDIYDEKTGESRAKVTPLIIACFEGDFDTIKYLVDNGADPNQTESEHQLTAIHILVDGPYKGQKITEKERAQLIRLMVAKGANINQLDKHQMAPIHKSVINDRIECLDALIEANVDSNAIFMGETALSIAARQNRDQIMKRLLNYSATKTDLKNQTGGTVLHFSAAGMVDSPECVQLLINAGLPVNIQDNRGNTPLMVACFFNKPRILRVLLDAHADVTIKNNEGKDAAAICDERENDDCKTILQSHQ